MKKTPLKRKSSLKTNSKLKRNKPIKAKSALKQTSSLKVNSGLKRSELKRNPNAELASVSVTKLPDPIKAKSKGLKGHGRSDDHKRIHSLFSATGCFACRMLGISSRTETNIHHIDGRNNGKKFDLSEYLVICLCVEHHAPINVCGLKQNQLSVHGNKRLFIKEIGTEIWCVYQSFKLINECPPWLTDKLWGNFCSIENHEMEDQWIIDFESRSVGYVPIALNYLIES